MRLLNAHTLEFVDFTASKKSPDYAILSHRWGDEEVGFNDLKTPKAREMLGYSKIDSCCHQAVIHGFEYVWIDTCCIDKSSSAELSEAINSMYSWYQKARVCYVYMSDVPNVADPALRKSSFQRSQWFTRGWTLQELLAPQTVIFYSQDWTEIGTKASLQETISEITGVPAPVILNIFDAEASTAMKMSWASKRETTRVEDMAYCLMGIFGVNMPILYGEGGNAFLRLQREIIQQNADQSIFAWRASEPGGERGLFARSPAEFKHSRDIEPFDFNTRKSPFNMTNFGLHIQLLMRPNPTTSEPQRFIASLNCRRAGSEGPVELYIKKHGKAICTRVNPGWMKHGSEEWRKSTVTGMYVVEPQLSTLASPVDRSAIRFQKVPTQKDGFFFNQIYPAYSGTEVIKEGAIIPSDYEKRSFMFHDIDGEAFVVTVGYFHNHLWSDLVVCRESEPVEMVHNSYSHGGSRVHIPARCSDRASMPLSDGKCVTVIIRKGLPTKYFSGTLSQVSIAVKNAPSLGKVDDPFQPLV